MVTKAIERAQNTVEARNSEIRKDVLKYDEVMDKQRQIIYAERRAILEGEDMHEQALELLSDVVENAVTEAVSIELPPEEWDWEALFARMREIYPTTLKPDAFDPVAVEVDEVVDAFREDALAVYRGREAELGGPEAMREVERLVLLSVVDNRWREHLYEMDYLQEGIGLRAVAQKDPLIEYQREGYAMFQMMQETIKEDFARYMFHIEAVREEERSAPPTQVREERRQIPMANVAATQASGVDPAAEPEEPQPEEPLRVEQRISDKVPRNAPCPCGSGKKYKQCHGRPGAAAL
jgi:preprotein translocase subunit SecA